MDHNCLKSKEEEAILSTADLKILEASSSAGIKECQQLLNSKPDVFHPYRHNIFLWIMISKDLF